MNITAVTIEVFLICLVLSIFYWRVIRVTAMTAIRFRLFTRRDELRRLALNEKEVHSSFAYREVESFICKTIAVIPSISLTSFTVFSIRNQNIKSKDADRFREEASEELIKLRDATVKDALHTMMLNSPILMTIGCVAALLLWIVGRFKKMLVYRQVEHFVDELASETEPLPQPA